MEPWSKNDLNAEQIQAIKEPGNVLLVACPGSGKTRTLTYKIAYELAAVTKEKRFVAAITYTHRAADEIHERIEDLGIETDQLWIGTIHSFCLEWILKPYAIYEPDLANGFHIIDSFEREKILETICKKYKYPRVTHWDCEYYFNSKGYVLSCAPNLEASVEKVLREYFEILASDRKLDFELILYYSNKLVQANPAISKILAKLFRVVLVDEYQDTKDIQYQIVAAILRGGDTTRAFIVGDPNQSIFQSLGGYPIAHSDLESLTGKKFKELELSTNYRSAPRIIEYFGNFKFHATNIVPSTCNLTKVGVVTFNKAVSLDDLRGEIVRLIRLSLSKGIPADEICVIAPWWFVLSSLTRYLVNDIPECQFNGPGMVPFSRDIDNFWYKVSKLALTEASPQMYVRRMRWAREILTDLETAGVPVSHITPKLLLRQCNLMAIEETQGLAYLQKFFDSLLAWLKVDLRLFGLLNGHYETFFKSSEERIARLKKDGATFISELSAFKRVFEKKSGITVSSIHGVKGAEYDCVIAYGLLDGMVPHFSEPNKKESALKMLYVIGSRARLQLHLISETGRTQEFPTPALVNCVFDYDHA